MAGEGVGGTRACPSTKWLRVVPKRERSPLLYPCPLHAPFISHMSRSWRSECMQKAHQPRFPGCPEAATCSPSSLKKGVGEGGREGGRQHLYLDYTSLQPPVPHLPKKQEPRHDPDQTPAHRKPPWKFLPPLPPSLPITLF